MSRTKQRPLAKVRHDLRTPVNHVIGYTELLMDQCQDLGCPGFESDLKKINAAARTWLELMECELIGARPGATELYARKSHLETDMFVRTEQQRSQAAPP